MCLVLAGAIYYGISHKHKKILKSIFLDVEETKLKIELKKKSYCRSLRTPNLFSIFKKKREHIFSIQKTKNTNGMIEKEIVLNLCSSYIQTKFQISQMSIFFGDSRNSDCF